jgi:hypothetical protein
MKTQLFFLAVLATATTNNALATLTLEAFGGFQEGSAVGFADTVNYYGCVDGICTSFSWGDPVDTSVGPFNGQSGASINTGIDPSRVDSNPEGNAVIQDPNTLDEFFLLGSLTHWNRVILGAGCCGEVQVEYDFAISDHLGDSVTLTEIYGVTFEETLNEEPCDPSPNPSGSTLPCDDKFQFFGNDSIAFLLSGVRYQIELAGFCPTEDPASCGDGTFYSAENATSIGYVLEVKRTIPAPGVLALVGIGLIGFRAASHGHRKV